MTILSASVRFGQADGKSAFGEFVFDWAWAEAYQRYGLEYYPKLVVAAPFTPATGPRILIAERYRSGEHCGRLWTTPRQEFLISVPGLTGITFWAAIRLRLYRKGRLIEPLRRSSPHRSIDPATVAAFAESR